MISKHRLTILIFLFLSGAGCSGDPPESHVSPVKNAGPLTAPLNIPTFPNRTALFGDLHVHTSWSFDAYGAGNRLGPNSAYRFARGEKVELPNGIETQLTVPLDFVAITDHAENFAMHLQCTIPGSPEFDSLACIFTRTMDQEDLLELAIDAAVERPAQRPELCAETGRCLSNARETWQKVQELANANNQPGKFTALIGYEFSSLLSDFGMLHRNVIFRGADVIPHAISSQDVINQADFFSQLDTACESPCKVLTIPHNTNYSWGLTFSRTDEDGTAYVSEDLQRRAKLERLFEVTQEKGNSECQLGVGFSDEDCDFEIMLPACKEGQTTKCVQPSSLLRNTLMDGLSLGVETDLNPFKLGIIASTDTHNSDPGNTRSEFPSTFASAARFSFTARSILEFEHVIAGPVRRMSAGGLAGVWAESNTREDIFDALHRREVFATSGSRIKIRFFSGNIPENIGNLPDPIAAAYATGVPMGADLVATDNPRFWVWALKDPNGPGLDRIQVIKGWVDDGEQRQRVWDVACSGDRVPGQDGKCPPTSASVDLQSCVANGERGDVELQTVFRDPGFSPNIPAFYYIRVFENPSCRWSTRLANAAGIEPPDDVPAIVQERAWSSPVWVASP